MPASESNSDSECSPEREPVAQPDETQKMQEPAPTTKKSVKKKEFQAKQLAGNLVKVVNAAQKKVHGQVQQVSDEYE